MANTPSIDSKKRQGSDPKPCLQQKRNTKELLHLKIPQHTIKAEPPCNTVRFDKDATKSVERDTKLDASTQIGGSRLPSSPRGRSLWQGLLPHNLKWIPSNLHKSHIRPVLRCAISAWISLLLILIPRTEQFLGKSGFIILVASFLSPPSDPFIAVLEKEVVIQLLVCGSFAWSCLGVKFASLARKEFHPEVSNDDVVQGRYIETTPSVICAIFLCIGTSFLLFLRAKMGQGKPIIAAMILSCTVMDSALTIAPLYPYPNYEIGKALVIPIALHSAICVLSAIFIFPESMHSQFRRRFHAVLSPLASALRSQPVVLQTPYGLLGATFDAGVSEYTSLVQDAETALGPLAASGRLMRRDFSIGRFCASDFKAMHELARRLTVRANGMAFYYKIMDPSRHKFSGTPVVTPTQSEPPSRPMSRPSSQPPSAPPTPGLEHVRVANPGHPHDSGMSRRCRITQTPRHATHCFHSHHPHHRRYVHHSGSSLFQEMRVRDPEHAVGAFESQAYLNLETRFAHPHADALRVRTMNLLGESAEPLLLRCADTVEYVHAWLQRVNDDRLWKRLVKRKNIRKWRDVIAEVEDVRAEIFTCFKDFRTSRRHRVLDLYRSTFETKHGGTPDVEEAPPHRYLFQCYLYQYHLIHFTMDLIAILDEIKHLESTRMRCKLWLPMKPLRKLFVWNEWDAADSGVNPEDDEDPDFVSGIDSGDQSQLETTARRDPDALPPTNVFGVLGRTVYHAFTALGHGNAVFAFKAGFMAALLSLPAFLPETVPTALSNRSVWAIVLGQTTLSRFRGDTVFGLISRILSTFFGGVVGMVMWYISAGDGKGNAFALGAVAAVCFPFFFFARIHYPGPPINVIFFFLTSQLVISYSWQDTHLPSISAAGYGFEVAWKRFLMVTIGVTVAFIFSFLPPSTTLRRYLRTTYATTADQIGQLYCDVVSLATVRDKVKTEEIVKNLVAVRMKLNRTRVLRKNAVYEFSLQGEWPAERYKRVLEIQMEIAYLLSHLRSVEEHLEPEWARAFLRRTRFMESGFQGDILSVICMISIALRTGSPLPQITPCPLLDRFVAHHGGMDDYGLPRSLTIETLENEQYLDFSVGIATAFGIITRLDRLMLATKELVGEHYHISGVLDMSHCKSSEKLFL